MILDHRTYLVTIKKRNGEESDLKMNGLHLRQALRDGSCDIISWLEVK